MLMVFLRPGSHTLPRQYCSLCLVGQILGRSSTYNTPVLCNTTTYTSAKNHSVVQSGCVPFPAGNWCCSPGFHPLAISWGMWWDPRMWVNPDSGVLVSNTELIVVQYRVLWLLFLALYASFFLLNRYYGPTMQYLNVAISMQEVWGQQDGPLQSPTNIILSVEQPDIRWQYQRYRFSRLYQAAGIHPFFCGRLHISTRTLQPTWWN